MDSKETKELITFYPWGNQMLKDSLPPKTARKELAPYYRDMPSYHGSGDEARAKAGIANRSNVFLSVKHCMPFFDAMTMGYHYLLHTDIYVNKTGENTVGIKWNSPHHPGGERPTFELPTPHGYYDSHFFWQTYWGIKTPPGWGVLMTHPLNRHDLPFTTVSGYVDFDKYPMPGNVSFHIKNNFEGVIPAGTPIMSIIPIKRASWESEVNTSSELWADMSALAAEKETVPMNHYKLGYRVGTDYK